MGIAAALTTAIYDAARGAFLAWIRNDYLRPVLLFACAMLLLNLPIVVYKVKMFVRGILYLLFCFDKSYPKPQDPGSIFGPHLSQGLPVERKTVYFVRHGESTWNETFNKGPHRTASQFVLGFIPGLIKALLYEYYLLLSGKMDSWFYDAPLSHLGLEQVEELASFLNSTKPSDAAEAEHLRVLRGDRDAPKSKVVCSNLRRAISTVAGGFRDRLARNPTDKVLVLDSLQEISRNPDTLAITPAHTPVQASWIEKASRVCNFQDVFDSQVDMTLHTGNKPLNTNGLKRMTEFCDFVFTPTNVKETHVIVGGHSIWFRSFFQMFLPYSVHHVAKNQKIVNCGVVTFELMKAETKRGPKYMIDPKTIRVVYGGF